MKLNLQCRKMVREMLDSGISMARVSVSAKISVQVLQRLNAGDFTALKGPHKDRIQALYRNWKAGTIELPVTRKPKPPVPAPPAHAEPPAVHASPRPARSDAGVIPTAAPSVSTVLFPPGFEHHFIFRDAAELVDLPGIERAVAHDEARLAIMRQLLDLAREYDACLREPSIL